MQYCIHHSNHSDAFCAQDVQDGLVTACIHITRCSSSVFCVLQALDPYFHGDNANGTHFPPSIPVVTHFIPGPPPRDNSTDGHGKERELLVSRYIPLKCNSTAPDAKSSEVHIHSFPAHKAYVRSFGGLGLAWNVFGEAKALAKALEHDKVGWQMHFECTLNATNLLAEALNLQKSWISLVGLVEISCWHISLLIGVIMAADATQSMHCILCLQPAGSTSACSRHADCYARLCR